MVDFRVVGWFGGGGGSDTDTTRGRATQSRLRVLVTKTFCDSDTSIQGETLFAHRRKYTVYVSGNTKRRAGNK